MSDQLPLNFQPADGVLRDRIVAHFEEMDAMPPMVEERLTDLRTAAVMEVRQFGWNTLAECVAEIDRLRGQAERAKAVERELRARFRKSNDELSAMRLVRPTPTGKRLEAAGRIIEWLDVHAAGYGQPIVGVTHRGAEELPLRAEWLWDLLMEDDDA